MTQRELGMQEHVSAWKSAARHRSAKQNRVTPVMAAPLCLLLIASAGCAIFDTGPNCTQVQTYEDTMNACVGSNISCYDGQRLGASYLGQSQIPQLVRTMPLAQNKMQYEYRLYYRTNYSQLPNESFECLTNVKVDQSTGTIDSATWSGQCWKWNVCTSFADAGEAPDDASSMLAANQAACSRSGSFPSDTRIGLPMPSTL